MELPRLGCLADRAAAVRSADTTWRMRPPVAGMDRHNFVVLPFQRASVSRCPLRRHHFANTHFRRVYADPTLDTEAFRRKLQIRSLEDQLSAENTLPIPHGHDSQAVTEPEMNGHALTNGHHLHSVSSTGPLDVCHQLHAQTSQQHHEAVESNSLDHVLSRSAAQPDASVPMPAPANHTTTSHQLDQPSDAVVVAAARAIVHDIPSTSTSETRTQSAATSTSETQTQSTATSSSSATGLRAQLQHIPQPILILSCVSMGLTMASCIFNSLMPVYMVTELKMSMRSMGMLEGILEAFSYLVRMCSGIVSDVLTNRKLTITAGFAMGAMAKFGLSFAGTVPQVFIGKAMDKLGNGVQAAPRDAMIGDLAPAEHRSSCFGFAQSLRKWGSTLGAISAYLLMRASNNNYQAIFLGAAALSAASTVAFVLLVPATSTNRAQTQQQQQQEQQQPEQPQTAPQQDTAAAQPERRTARQHWAALVSNARALGPKFFQFLLVVGLYGCGHIGESLLEARAVEVGFGKAESTLVIALLCFVVFLCAYPLGRLADKHGQRFTFTLGMASLIAGDLVLLTSGTFPLAVFVACIFWGMHWAVVQGPLLSIVVQLSPPHLRGTAFGIFYTVMAATAVAANSFFGYIWHTYSATAAFGASAALVTATLLALPWLLPEEQRDQQQQEDATQLKMKMA